jgi:hypothetical protein
MGKSLRQSRSVSVLAEDGACLSRSRAKLRPDRLRRAFNS